MRPADSMSAICIVTPDLVGMVRNGGVGTACTELAKALAAYSHAVTILFTQVGALTDPRAEEDYRCLGIHLVVAEGWAGEAARADIFPPHPLLRMSRIAHEWLKDQQFDLVLFMDWQGTGFYPMMARRGGGHRQHGAFGIICHGLTLWSDLGSGARRRDPLDAITYFIERRSIEMADVVISPSRYLLEWMQRRGFQLPRHALVLPNLLEAPISDCSELTPEDVVFFGRLEYRKGLAQFCSAIDCLVARGEAPQRVIFLGKLGFVGDEHAAVYLARRSRDWPIPIEILNRFSQPEALRFLTTRRCLAVVPSTVENSPYTVYECLMAGIPVIARNVGGIAELYEPRCRATHLFDDNPAQLADRIAAALAGELPVARLSFSPDGNRKAWVEGLPTLVEQVRQNRAQLKSCASTPLVSICLTHYRRPHLLLQAVNGVLAQTYANIQVILVDDGSGDDETQALLVRLEAKLAGRDWHIIRTTNGFPGRARNIAAAEARGNYLLFLDDDNVATPQMVETLVAAAIRSDADAVTCFASVFEGADEPGPETRVNDTYMPVGGALGYALAGNAISDTSALLKRELFDELGGFTEDYGVGHEDFELFLRAALRRKDILVVPEPLYWYRRQPSSVGSVTPHAANRARSLRPFLDHFGPDMAELLVVAHGMVDTGGPAAGAEEADSLDGNKAVLAQRDPDSWQSIDAAAAIIAARGATDLARQILRQLPDGTPGWELRRLRADAIGAAAAGERSKLLASLHASQRFGNAALCDVLSLSARVAWRKRQPLAADLLQDWARLDTEALEPRLLLVDALDEEGRVGDAVGSFVDALRVADGAYRAARPDVDAAIGRGEFETGLVHYERHGRHENAPWPRAAAFRRVAARLTASLGNRCLIGPPAFVGVARLGFATFAPGREVALAVQEAVAD